jgi:hypothetical protein
MTLLRGSLRRRANTAGAAFRKATGGEDRGHSITGGAGWHVRPTRAASTRATCTADQAPRPRWWGRCVVKRVCDAPEGRDAVSLKLPQQRTQVRRPFVRSGCLRLPAARARLVHRSLRRNLLTI